MIKVKAGLVMVFGVFDRLHPGHRSFLRQAKKYGKELTVVVARDNAVYKLKKKKPSQSEKTRLGAVQRVHGVNCAVFGDDKQGSYAVIKKYKPGIVCLGYDQKWLERDLCARMHKKKIQPIRLIRLKAHRPKKFHTSLLK